MPRRCSRGCARSRRGTSRPTGTSHRARPASRARCCRTATIRTSPGTASSVPTARSPRASASAACWRRRASLSGASGSTCARPGSRCSKNLRVSNETVRYDVSDGVATIALDQPDTRNALSNELLTGLTAAFELAAADDAVRCVVLTSTHDKVFSAGGSLDQFADDVALVHKHFGTERFPRLFRTIMQLGKPSICAANGHVLAGALGLALACDLVVAREGATFGTPEINVGVFPFMIMALIYRNVGRKKTNELLLLGERINAREAERIGIVNSVLPADEFAGAVSDWAERLAEKSPLLMRMGKDAMYRQQDLPLAEPLEFP